MKQILNPMNIIKRKPCTCPLNNRMLVDSFILKQKERSIKQQTQNKEKEEGKVN